MIKTARRIAAQDKIALRQSYVRTMPKLIMELRDRFRRRAAIEPQIGHHKNDHRLGRNFLHGIHGYAMNCCLPPPTPT